MHSSSSAPSHSSRARSSAASGSISPNSTTSGFSGAAQRSQRGTPSGARAQRARAPPPARRCRRSAGQEQLAMLPCTSTSSRVPALRWSMSMFCVITASSRPRALERDERAVRARWAASRRASRSAGRRSPRSARGRARNASMCATSIGSTFSHSPVPGERKSGIPEGTEMPAPVSATTELRLANQLGQPVEVFAHGSV